MGECMDQLKGGLPIIMYPGECGSSQDVVDSIVSALVNGYREFAGEDPGSEQVSAWASSLSALLDELAGLNYPVIVEYPILGGLDRIDFIVVGLGKALIVEAKGWRNVKPRSDFHVIADGRVEVNPCYQLNSYHAKMTHLHSASKKMEFDAVVYAYKVNTPWPGLNCTVVPKGGLRGLVQSLPPSQDVGRYVKEIIDGKLELSESLITTLRRSLEKSVSGIVSKLLSRGYGLVGVQAELVADIISELESGESELFYIIYGTSGSGKTLIALTLFLAALSRGYKALLGYVNNRLVNILRRVIVEEFERLGSGNLGKSIARLIGYFAVGPERGYKGFCEGRHNYSSYGDLVDLLVIDEAQRMPSHALETCPRHPVRVIVAFVDDQQILLGREVGTAAKLKECAEKAGREVKEYMLPGPVRVPERYLKAVRSLLQGSSFNPQGIEVRVFDWIEDMLNELRARCREGRSIALICAFTESEGDRKSKLSWSSKKNIRIGYPLQSGFDLYKGLNFKVKWLMDEGKEYPAYWAHDYTELARLYGMKCFDPVTVCSSVYGAQGMEAEYVGVVWGRDLVWRNGRWTVNPDSITDNIGGKYSLKSIAKRDKKRALELLHNRYYIMLTRATKGVYLFFEDEETKRYVKRLLEHGG